MRHRLYDEANDRLVYIGQPADAAFWDGHWEKDPKLVRQVNRFVRRHTMRYLDPPARVIDTGCGLAHSVFGLHKEGFDAWGLDYAPRTIEFVKSVAPELQIKLGDVRVMPFEDAYFDGVWSLGVVEHFFDGYDDIVEETRRILRPGGYAFVTVPSMSPLRRLKARRGQYDSFDGDSTDFYQFALPAENVVDRFTAGGFELIEDRARGGVMGLNDEVDMPLLPQIFKSRNPFLKAIKVGLDQVLTPFSFHIRFYVFRAV